MNIEDIPLKFKSFSKDHDRIWDKRDKLTDPPKFSEVTDYLFEKYVEAQEFELLTKYFIPRERPHLDIDHFHGLSKITEVLIEYKDFGLLKHLWSRIVTSTVNELKYLHRNYKQFYIETSDHEAKKQALSYLCAYLDLLSSYDAPEEIELVKNNIDALNSNQRYIKTSMWDEDPLEFCPGGGEDHLDLPKEERLQRLIHDSQNLDLENIKLIWQSTIQDKKQYYWKIYEDFEKDETRHRDYALKALYKAIENMETIGDTDEIDRLEKILFKVQNHKLAAELIKPMQNRVALTDR